MGYCDYVIKHTDDMQELAYRILYSVYIRRIKGHKPAITMVVAPSGEGKSWGVIKLEEALLELQGMKLTPDIVKVINIFTPLEYPEKMNAILFDKKYKKINIVAIHEARDVVSSNNWQDFITKAIASINTQSRRIKPLIIFIISQHVSDIARSTRVTCTYYIEAQRSIGKKTKFYMNKVWERKHGLEKSELMPRRMKGFIVDTKGKYRGHYLKCLEMSKPSKENIKAFEKMDLEAKAGILAHKLSETMKRIKRDVGNYGEKLDAMADWYMEDKNRLETIGKRFRGKWKVKPEIAKAHDLSKEETLIFEKKMLVRLDKEGLISMPKVVENESKKNNETL